MPTQSVQRNKKMHETKLDSSPWNSWADEAGQVAAQVAPKYETVVRTLCDVSAASVVAHNKLVEDKLEGLIELAGANKDNPVQYGAMKSLIIDIFNRFPHDPAYLFALGVDPQNEKHMKHLFNGSSPKILKERKFSDPHVLDAIASYSLKDNAIILSAGDRLLSIGTHLVGLTRTNGSNGSNGFSIYTPEGFKKGARHTSAELFTGLLPGTTCVVGSETTGGISVFRGGKRVYYDLSSSDRMQEYKPEGIVKEICGHINHIREGYYGMIDSVLDEEIRKHGIEIDEYILPLFKQEIHAARRESGHRPAFSTMVGLDASDPLYHKHILEGVRDNPFVGLHILDDLKKPADGMSLEEYLVKVVSKEDNAGIVGKEGRIVSLFSQYVNVDPKCIPLDYNGNPEIADLNDSRRFGIQREEGIGRRLTSAIGASYRCPETIIYVKEETNGTERLFFRGMMIASSNTDEMEYVARRNLARLGCPKTHKVPQLHLV